MNNEEIAEMSVRVIEMEMANMQLQYLEETALAATLDFHDNGSLEFHSHIQDNLNELQEEIRMKMNQATQLNAFEIFGVPEDIDSTEDVAGILSEALGVPIAESAIRGFETLETIRLRSDEPMSVPDVVLVVHMNEREERDCIISLASPGPATLEGEPAPLYFAEHLTFMNKQILRRALQQAVVLNFSTVWVTNGKIFVRKTEASPAHQIHGEDVTNMANLM